jgi:hypothetical protein
MSKTLFSYKMSEPKLSNKGSSPEREIDSTHRSLVSILEDACKVTEWSKKPDYKRILSVMINNRVSRELIVKKEKAIKLHLFGETLIDVDEIDFKAYLSSMSPAEDDLSTPTTLGFMPRSASDIQPVSCSTNSDALDHSLVRRMRSDCPAAMNGEFQKEVSHSTRTSDRPSSVHTSTRQSSPAPSVELVGIKSTLVCLVKLTSIQNIQGEGLHTRIYSWKSRSYYPAIYLEEGKLLDSLMRFTVAERAQINLREDNSCTLKNCRGHAWLFWQPIDCVGMIDTKFHIVDLLPAELVMGRHALQRAECLRISSASQDAHENLRQSIKPPRQDLQGFSTGVNAPLTPDRTPSPPSARRWDETWRGRKSSNQSGSITPTQQATGPISVPKKEAEPGPRQLHQRFEDIEARPSSGAKLKQGGLDAFKEPEPKDGVPQLERCVWRLNDAQFKKTVLVFLTVQFLLTSICFSVLFRR